MGSESIYIYRPVYMNIQIWYVIQIWKFYELCNILISLCQIAIEIHSEGLVTLPADQHLSYLQDKYDILRAIEVMMMYICRLFKISFFLLLFRLPVVLTPIFYSKKYIYLFIYDVYSVSNGKISGDTTNFHKLTKLLTPSK